jgi:PST family polysaccharide transporter
MTSSSSPPRTSSLPPATQELVLGNALLLVVAQALSTPLSMLTNAVMGRYIGPEDFGRLYLATTTASIAFLFVDWGTGGTLPANVAKERARAGEFLGTSITWRLCASLVLGGLLVLGSWAFGQPTEFRKSLALVILISTVSTVAGLLQDAARGFERTDVSAVASVGGQFIIVLLVVPTLLLGGKLGAALVAQLAAATIVLGLVWKAIRALNVGALSFRIGTLKTLLREGSPFLFFGIAMVLQPYIDAAFLSAYAPPETMGWLSAAKKLVGVLLAPASALISALYPTLCRLHAQDPSGYRRAVRDGLSSSTLVVVPVSLGCGLYPDIGVRIFGRDSFEPAESNLRILAIFIFLVYFSMVVGTALLAAGRARAWAGIQFLCVVVSLVLDPLLVPWFQARTHNGGLGVCVSNVASEVLMVAGGIWLLRSVGTEDAPPGSASTRPRIFDGALVRQLSLACLAGGAMIGTARLLSRLPGLAAAPVAVAAYVGCLWITGAVTRKDFAAVSAALARKVRRR